MHNQLPNLLHEMLETNSDIHTHNTRQMLTYILIYEHKTKTNVQTQI
jgi:hypothetical protein